MDGAHQSVSVSTCSRFTGRCIQGSKLYASAGPGFRRRSNGLMCVHGDTISEAIHAARVPASAHASTCNPALHLILRSPNVQQRTIACARRVCSHHGTHTLQGAATYYKLLAWTFTCYSRILLVDADVRFKSNPDLYLSNVALAPYFAAMPAVADRSYTGINTHIVCLSPDRQLFRQLLAKAASGQYFAYTNSDQDVLETLFTNEGDPHFPADRHHHLRERLPTPHGSGATSNHSAASFCLVDEYIDRALYPRRTPQDVPPPVVVGIDANVTGKNDDDDASAATGTLQNRQEDGAPDDR